MWYVRVQPWGAAPKTACSDAGEPTHMVSSARGDGGGGAGRGQDMNVVAVVAYCRVV